MTESTGLVATIIDVASRAEYAAVSVSRLSSELIVLRPGEDRPPAGTLVEVTLLEGSTRVAVLDGEALAGAEPDQLVVRLMNLDPALRDLVRQTAARFRLDGTDDPERQFGRAARQRRRTAVMDEESLDRLRESASGPHSPATAMTEDATPVLVMPGGPRRSYDTLEQALLGALPVEAGPLSDDDAVPTLSVAPESIDLGTLDARAASVLAVVDGERTIDRIIAASPLNRSVTLELLGQLYERGLIKL